MNIKKHDMIKFKVKHTIDIPNPIPEKAVLLEKISESNIPKQYVIDSITKKVAYDFLGLPPCHCALNTTDMVWNKLNYHVCNFSFDTCQPSKVADFVAKVFDKSIST